MAPRARRPSTARGGSGSCTAPETGSRPISHARVRERRRRDRPDGGRAPVRRPDGPRDRLVQAARAVGPAAHGARRLRRAQPPRLRALQPVPQGRGDQGGRGGAAQGRTGRGRGRGRRGDRRDRRARPAVRLGRAEPARGRHGLARRGAVVARGRDLDPDRGVVLARRALEGLAPAGDRAARGHAERRGRRADGPRRTGRDGLAHVGFPADHSAQEGWPAARNFPRCDGFR